MGTIGPAAAWRLTLAVGMASCAAGSVLGDVAVIALPTSTPYGFAQANVFSGDGSTAAGTHHDNFVPPTGVKWNSAGQPSSAGVSVVTGLSFDGSAAGGTAYIFVRPKEFTQQAAIAHAGSATEYLALPNGASASSGGLMSADANTMIVNASSSNLLWRRGHGYVTAITGMDSLNAMSGDGSTIVGRSNNTTASYWRMAGGAQLISVPGATGSAASAVSPDGLTIVGTAYTPANRAFIWDAQNGARLIESVSGPVLTSAIGISADRSVIVGSDGSDEPVVWTPSASYLLTDILHGAGIHDLDGSALFPRALSADGTRILLAGSSNGQWIVTIPAPASAVGLGAGLLLAFRRRTKSGVSG